MNPLIYIPGQPPRNDETLEALGLGPLLDADSVCAMWSDLPGATPDGERGVLVQFDAPRRPASSSPRGLNLEMQQWKQASRQGELEKGRYWLGWDREHRPGPQDLRRGHTVSGEMLTLLDGQNWDVAVQYFVPTRLGIDIETGEQVRVPQGEYVPFVERCRALEAQLFEQWSDLTAEDLADRTVSLPDGLRFATEALAINYRLVPDLVDGLELLSDREVGEIVMAAVGISTMALLAREKKTE